MIDYIGYHGIFFVILFGIFGIGALISVVNDGEQSSDRSGLATPDSSRVAEVKNKLGEATLIVWKDDSVTRVSLYDKSRDKVEHREVDGVTQLTTPKRIAQDAKLVLEKPSKSSNSNDDLRYETAATAWAASISFNEAFSRTN
jgi:hypothetical protein